MQPASLLRLIPWKARFATTFHGAPKKAPQSPEGCPSISVALCTLRRVRRSIKRFGLRFSYWYSPVRNASPVKKVSDASRDRDSGQVGCGDGIELAEMLRVA